MPSSLTQLRRAQPLSIPSSVTGEEAEPQTHFHTALDQHTWDDRKTKARATTCSDFLLLDGHVSATKPSLQLQRNFILIVLFYFQHRQMLQKHTAISTSANRLCNKGGKKTTKGFYKNRSQLTVFQLPLNTITWLINHH